MAEQYKVVTAMVSCVVPVYNEADRVLKVLAALKNHPLIDEVIVVNDGSTDDSGEVLRKADGINLISYKKNRGKSYAIMLGIKRAKHDLILTVDSDLQGLEAEDISALIEPVLRGESNVAMTLRKNSLGIFRLFGLDFVSGERIFYKNLIKNIDDLAKLSSFGLEVFLNQLIIENKMPIKVVKWEDVVTPRKARKFGFWEGTKGDLKMVKQIVNHLGVFGVARQFWKMWKLKI